MFGKAVIAVALSAAFMQPVSAVQIFSEDFEYGLDGQFTAVNVASSKDWNHDSYSGVTSAVMNGYGADGNSDDWLISPAIDLTDVAITDAILKFTARVRFDGQNLALKASTDYMPGMAPEEATWTDLNPSLPQDGQGSSGSDFEASGDIDLSAYLGQTLYFAYQYQTSADEAGNNGAWYIDDVVVEVTAENYQSQVQAGLVMSAEEAEEGEAIQFLAYAYGGAGEGYSFDWDFGDGETAQGAELSHTFSAGEYAVNLTVTDADNNTQVVSRDIIIEAFESPPKYIVKEKQSDEHIRVATFNVSMEAENYTSTDVDTQGSQILADELASGDNQQIKNTAQIIQRIRPDVIVLNEFDYIADTNSGVEMFISQYLNIAQHEDVLSIDYPYFYVAPSNTGEPTSFDLNNDGEATGTQDDAYGFGRFPGHYAMVILSRLPIDEDNVRTFQNFLWKDMPGNLMPTDPQTGSNWYNEAETAEFRLSSKTHWDIPVIKDGETLHILASHPTPPTFDGEEDRNGRRNHDEIRFWADYVDSEASDYIYDDMGETGGLAEGSRFVIAGDLNASIEGDAYPGTIDQLLLNEHINADYAPSSDGGIENAKNNPLAAFHTASWAMRADYVLPSESGLKVEQGNVFWPTPETDLAYLVADRASSSDHRLVWMDLAITETQSKAETEDQDSGGGASGYLFVIAGFVLAMIRRKNFLL